MEAKFITENGKIFFVDRRGQRFDERGLDQMLKTMQLACKFMEYARQYGTQTPEEDPYFGM